MLLADIGRNGVVPVALSVFFGSRRFLVGQGDAQLGDLGLHDDLVDLVLHGHGAEQFHVGAVGQVIVIAVGGDQTVVNRLYIGPGQFRTVDRGQHVGILKLGRGSVLRQRCGGEQQAQAEQERENLLHEKHNPFLGKMVPRNAKRILSQVFDGESFPFRVSLSHSFPRFARVLPLKGRMLQSIHKLSTP